MPSLRVPGMLSGGIIWIGRWVNDIWLTIGEVGWINEPSHHIKVLSNDAEVVCPIRITWCWSGTILQPLTDTVNCSDLGHFHPIVYPWNDWLRSIKGRYRWFIGKFSQDSQSSNCATNARSKMQLWEQLRSMGVSVKTTLRSPVSYGQLMHTVYCVGHYFRWIEPVAVASESYWYICSLKNVYTWIWTRLFFQDIPQFILELSRTFSELNRNRVVQISF